MSFGVIGIRGIDQCQNDGRLRLTGCQNIISGHREDEFRDGIGLFIKDNLIYTLIDDICVFNTHIVESVFIEITDTHGKSNNKCYP